MSYRKIDKDKYKIDVETTVDGKRHRKSKRVTTKLKGSALKSFLNSEEINLIEELQQLVSDIGHLSKMKFKEFAEYHISVRKLAAKTKDWYEDYLGGLVEIYIGNKTITKITETDIESLFDALKASKSKYTSSKYSAKTIKHYHTAVHAVFTTAIKKGIISKNPASNINLEPVKRGLNKNYYSPTEISECSNKLRENGDLELELYFTLSVTCGLRPSELFALKWKNINLSNNSVLVNRALVLTKGGYVYKNTKTEDERELPLTNYLILLLKRHRKNEIKKHKKIGIFGDLGDTFVFTNEHGEHLKETTQRDKWKKFCIDNGLKYVTPYGLRHSSATLLAYNKIPMINIAKQLGHTSTSTTEIYVHAAEEVDKEIQNIMESVTAPVLKLVK